MEIETGPRPVAGHSGIYRNDSRRAGTNHPGMSELERLLHLFVSLQILFGSRRGGMAPLIVIALLVAGWFLWAHYNNPLRTLETADRRWDTGVTQDRIDAIAEYKSILRGKDAIDPQRKLLGSANDRARLYRRIIEYHVKFDRDLREGREWVIAAWQENLRDLNFGEEKLDGFYRMVVDDIRSRGVRAPIDPQRINMERLDQLLPSPRGAGRQNFP